MPEQSWSDKRERQYEHIKSSQQKRGGRRSGNRQGPGGPTKDQLHNEANERDIKGRSRTTKKGLQNALGR
ncbi:hypothetical protein P3102_28365 [Amycolatopsis sp. QT-25]|uniref:hypothetical protein n=1 Tax=Amycolatopsis sp. QT-25 TaxID=3034022 RepID=UPI0023EB0CDF|nr:hypothetical protein [Amycolatopsis sp. QT-25]WET77959.1 hypothetical protein P3102_28365 [Amycolatopsis sp. QT-25]